MATRAEQALIKRKQGITHEIRNIKQDYADVLAEDLPTEISKELKKLMDELRSIREQLEKV